jgi:hypothetical protein
MMFDQNEQPLSEDEYKERLFTIMTLVLMEVGPQLVIRPETLAKLASTPGRSWIEQGRTADGGLVYALRHE